MQSVYAFLLTEPAEQINTLYQSPWCALAVYQSLDSLSKQCVRGGARLSVAAHARAAHAALQLAHLSHTHTSHHQRCMPPAPPHNVSPTPNHPSR